MGFNVRFRVRLSAVNKGKREVLCSPLMVSQVCMDCVLCRLEGLLSITATGVWDQRGRGWRIS